MTAAIRSLAARYYTDPQVFKLETEGLLARTWQFGCHGSELAKIGDYATFEVAGESLFAVRGRDENIRVFYNVCQHRAHQLVSGTGTTRVIVCPYHAWTYELTGELRAGPNINTVEGFDKSGICLTEVRAEEFLGFIFFNLDTNATPLASQLTGMNDEFRSFCAEPEKLKRAYTKTYEVKANWKNVIENYSECYHCPPAHPTLAQNALDMTDYRIEVRGAYHHHNSGNRGDMQGYDINIGDSPRADEFGGWYLYPGVSFEFYPGGKLTVFHNVPDGPEKTIQNIEWYLGADTPTEEEQAVIDFVDVVRREDFPLVESVQRGLHSQGYGRGRFAIDKDRTYLSEHAVHDLQHKVLTALGDIAASDNSA